MTIAEINKKIEKITNEWTEFYNENKNNKQIEELETKMSNIENFIGRTECPIFPYESKSEFGHYIRKGEISGLETKAFSSNEEEGGYLLTPSLHNRIISGLTAKSPMRQIASIETISTNALDVIIEDGAFSSGWALDSETRAETSTPKLQQKRILVHELYSQPKATQRLLDDAAINIEQWIVERLQDSFARAENKSFISGDGTNQPSGILSNKNIQHIESQEDEDISIEDILNLINSLDEHYLTNATFLMNRSTLSNIQKIQDTNGRFIWQPSISESTPETLFGIPVVCCSEMPNIMIDACPVAIADFKAAYKIVDRSGISIMRDPYTEKPFVKFYSVKRVGGDVVDANAIKLLKITKQQPVESND